MLNRKKRLALILNFELLLPDDDIIGKIMEMMGDNTIQRGLIRKEDDSCSHYCRSTEISRLSHFRFALPEINFVLSNPIINISLSDLVLFKNWKRK